MLPPGHWAGAVLGTREALPGWVWEEEQKQRSLSMLPKPSSASPSLRGKQPCTVQYFVAIQHCNCFRDKNSVR